MSKPVKEMITRDLASRYGQESNAVWVQISGVDGITTNEFRRSLRAKQMRLEIVKSSLLRRACAQGPLARLAGALEGPAALVTGGESAVDVAKALEEWLPKLTDRLKMRGAVLEGEYIDEGMIGQLSKMPNKRDLQARVIGCAMSPGANLLAALLGPGGAVMGCVKSLIEKLEKGEPAAEVSPSSAPTTA